jgi:hypothetical protein
LKAVTGRHEAVTEPLPDRPETHRPLPVRYQVKEDESGRFLTCVEASNIAVRIDRTMSVSSSSARKYPKGTIFLDGAAKGEPFMDSSKGVYNLDHHEGCVRSFTLSTCEQAVIVIRKGLDLDGEQWAVWANDPDLDTILAIWLLLNHRRINDEGSAVRRKIMPIVRLQGVIDAHGFELKELTAFPENLQDAALTVINGLRTEEIELKRENRWGGTDFLDFTLSSLQKLDELVYTPHDFEEGHAVEELARERILPQRIAVACRSEAGIYEVEEQLRDLHNDRLGLVILEKEPGTYTLRQVDPFLPTGLEALYERLNLLDPQAAGEAQWGGSNEIGGSPRGVKTGLSLGEIMFITRWVYQPPSSGRKLGAIIGSVATAFGALVIAALAGGSTLDVRFIPGLMVNFGFKASAPRSLRAPSAGRIRIPGGSAAHGPPGGGRRGVDSSRANALSRAPRCGRSGVGGDRHRSLAQGSGARAPAAGLSSHGWERPALCLGAQPGCGHSLCVCPHHLRDATGVVDRGDRRVVGSVVRRGPGRRPHLWWGS